MSKFHDYFNIILGFLFPKTKYENIVEKITVNDLFYKANSQSKLSEGNSFVLFRYNDHTVKELIWALKYKGKRKVAKLFSDVLYEHLLEILSEETLFSNFDCPIIIPIPLSKKRMRERGFNQSELIAKRLKHRDKANFFDMYGDVLVRVRDTEHQAHMQKAEDRLKNVRGAFSVSDTSKIKGRNIILLDDVVTTGNTMREAYRVLIAAGVKKIIVVAIAH